MIDLINLFNMIETYMSEPILYKTTRWEHLWIMLMVFMINFVICWFLEEIYVVKTDEYYIREAKKRLEKENKKCKN